MMLKINKIFLLAGLSIIVFGGISCGRDNQTPIPYIYVNYTVYLNSPSSSNLRVPGGHAVIEGHGNHGIFLYRRSLGESDDFIAFDRTCSNEPLGNCIVKLDDTEFYLECPCCGSKFSVFDGYPSEGPAKWPLKQYQAHNSGNTLRIYN